MPWFMLTFFNFLTCPIFLYSSLKVLPMQYVCSHKISLLYKAEHIGSLSTIQKVCS
jgi:hypothetical protein